MSVSCECDSRITDHPLSIELENDENGPPLSPTKVARLDSLSIDAPAIGQHACVARGVGFLTHR